MKWSGFIIGGIAGIAAVAYLSKRKPNWVAWAGTAAGEVMTGMKGKAINAVMNRKFGPVPAASAPKRSSASAGKASDAWGQIEMIMNSDPAVKREAEQIASQSQSH
ncbi:hypothetical protein [Paenibacillus spongiae]|uniref:YtxH domain-containing protein n=1 Tax=Paenibacillus spongiae TaxID=2909671 RepID=A0ABY5SFP3_9BACL|nr:hypothetical protein [Paenibacillus spongiae]UVI32363.1 hypothetical protein L1F29_11315 [Paenibacillus spongiae]